MIQREVKKEMKGRKESIGWWRASDTAQWTVNASANILRETYIYGTRVSHAKSHPCVWKRDSVHKWLPTGNQRYEMTETGRTRETRIRLEISLSWLRENIHHRNTYSGTITVNGRFENDALFIRDRLFAMKGGKLVLTFVTPSLPPSPYLSNSSYLRQYNERRSARHKERSEEERRRSNDVSDDVTRGKRSNYVALATRVRFVIAALGF